MRARLELDRTLRTRPFFVRAARGQLVDQEYAGLLAQVSHFLGALEPACRDLLHLAAADLGATAVAPPCAAIRLAAPIFKGLEPPELGLRVGLTIVGTSWAEDTARSFRGSLGASFLGALPRCARESLARLEQGMADRTFDPEQVQALAEIGRGVVLGIATHLDAEWPPPVFELRRD
jgi:hypothetical protein